MAFLIEKECQKCIGCSHTGWKPVCIIEDPKEAEDTFTYYQEKCKVKTKMTQINS